MKKLLKIAVGAFLSLGLCTGIAVAQPGHRPPPPPPAHHVAPPPPPRPAPRPDMGPDHHRPVPRDCRMCDDMRRRCYRSPYECDMQYNRCMHECRPVPPPHPHHHPLPPPPPPHHHH